MPIAPRAGTRPPRLLVISFHFPPDGSVGGLRWSGLSKYLARAGWEVHVVTASRQDGQTALPGVFVHHRARAETLNDLYNRVANRLRASLFAADQQADTAPVVMSTPAKAAGRSFNAVARFRRHVSLALDFPDFGRGWILRASITARALLRSQEFDAVVTSGPPHSSHMAGVLACMGRRELHWVDMRDPLAVGVEHVWARNPMNPPGVRVLLPHLERLIFRRAHGVVTNTPELAELLGTHYPALRVAWVPNGIDRERLPAPTLNKLPGFSIAYVGTLYLGRDLTVVLDAMRALIALHSTAAGVVRLRVAGSMDEGHEARLLTQIRAAGLEDAVELLGSLPSAAALELTNRSHLALVLAPQQPTQVPAKLYECVALGLPTLVLTETTSASAREARRIGAMIAEPDDVQGVMRVLESLWLTPDEILPSRAAIGYEDVATLMDAVLRGRVPARSTWSPTFGAPAVPRAAR